MNERVCAVVVTFNRKALLRECLKALEAQTRPIDTILAVNNQSTDGTLDMLAAEFPNVQVLDLGANLGGAGGFHAGVKWGYENGYEWLWIMDDDIAVYPSTLERMLTYRDLSDFIHFRREGPEGAIPLEAMWDISGAFPVPFGRDISFDNGRPWISLTAGCFEGPLIHRRVVDKIGFPDARFFVSGDDTMYGLAASFHVNVIYVNEFGIHRNVYGKGGTRRSRMDVYLQIRNRFLVYEHLRGLHVPLSRAKFRYHQTKLLFWMAAHILGRPDRQSFTKLVSLARGFRDGMRGRFGPPPWLQ
jgi:GT2 family glycosyltransferase